MGDITRLFDISRPGAFIALYRTLVGLRKPGQKEPLVNTTKRLIHSYLRVQKELTAALNTKTKGLVEWLRKRKIVQSLKLELDRKSERIMTWVSKSITFFCKPV